MDGSVSLIIIYIIGIFGLCTAAKDIIEIPFEFYLLLCSVGAIFTFALWYLFFYQKRIFIYSTVIICLAGAAVIVPQVLSISQHFSIYGTANFSSLINATPLTAIVLILLVLYILFAVEFVLRNHSVLFLLSAAILIVPPIFGMSVSTAAAIMTVIFQIGFTVVNMTGSRSPRDSFKMTTRAKAGTASCLCVVILVLAALMPSFPIENSAEEDLFLSVYYADGAIKDNLARFTGDFDSNISGGEVSRGNLRQTGEPMIYISTDKRPSEKLYLSNFKGITYSNGEWSNAFEYYGKNNEYIGMEPLLSSIMKQDNIQAPWSDVSSSDPISDIYFRMGYKTPLKSYEGTLELEDSSNDIYNMRIFNISRNTINKYYIPYNAEYSAGEIIKNINKSVNTGYGYMGYENNYIRSDKINMNELWALYPEAEKLVDRYEEEMKYYYTIVPEGNERLEKLCRETPLNDLNEITTFILYTLQTKAKYTVNPGTAPFNKDIVDYFLFDNGKGYCVHFASAAALMYKMYGIPSRYVTGLAVTPDSFVERNMNNTNSKESDKGYFAEVKDYASHAWVEIFLKDYGWVPVDVTPTESGTMNVSYPGYDKYVMNRIMEEHDWHFSDRSEEDSSDDSDDTFNDESDTFSYVWILAILGGALIFVIVFFPSRRIFRLHRIKTADSRRLFDLIIKSIHFCGILEKYNGSEEEFAELLSKNIDVISNEQANRLIDIMLKVNYSEYSHNKEDDDFVRTLYIGISKYLYGELVWYKKPIYKFIKAYI